MSVEVANLDTMSMYHLREAEQSLYNGVGHKTDKTNKEGSLDRKKKVRESAPESVVTNDAKVMKEERAEQ